MVEEYAVNVVFRPIQPSIDKGDVEALCRRAEAHAATTRVPARSITFKELCRMAAARKVIPFETLLRAVMDGKPRPHLTAPKKLGMSRLKFGRREAEIVLVDLARSTRTGMMPLRDAARTLEVREPAMMGLVAAELLPTPLRLGNFILFDTAAMKAFWEAYTYPPRVAKLHATSPAYVTKALDAAGVIPVACIPTDQLPLRIYRIEDVAGVEIPVTKKRNQCSRGLTRMAAHRAYSGPEAAGE
jgi:hypothetical protein